MHGFFGSYKQDVSYVLSSYDKGYIQNTLAEGGLHVERRTLNKFIEDKPWVNDSRYAYSLEGIIFSPTTDLAALYEQYGETFMHQLRGSFSGFFYDKKQDILLVFNDQIGEKMLFFYADEQGVAFASDWQIMAHALSERADLSLNESFCWGMLSYGYSPLQETPISSIHRLGAGEYLRIQDGIVKREKYHQFQNTPIVRSEQEYLQNIDTLFRQAVKRVLDKNKQYGLDNLFALSAGLDSRMTVCVAKHLSEDSGLDCFTYSQSGYYDETTPRQIAEAWELPLHFTPLDNGDYLRNIEQATKATSGLVNYSGAVQVQHGTDFLITPQTGIVLTGMIGDIVINSPHKNISKAYFGEGAISTRYLAQFQSALTHAITPTDQELYYLYVRAFDCANLGSPSVFQIETESYSPFYDVDLLEYVYTIPRTVRYNYHLYDQWILHYYPEAAAWTHNGTRVIGKSPAQVTLFGRTIPTLELPKRLFWYACKQLHIHDFYRQRLGESMNPEDYWLETNHSLKKYLDDYVTKHLSLLNSHEEIKKAAQDLYETGTAMERFNVLSLLAGLRSF